MQGQSCITLP